MTGIRKLVGPTALLILASVACAPESSSDPTNKEAQITKQFANRAARSADEPPYTLRLIFDGLIAVVPDRSGRGMTALAIRENSGHGAGGFPTHRLVIGALGGTLCRGNCTSRANENLPLVWRWGSPSSGLNPDRPTRIELAFGSHSSNLAFSLTPTANFVLPADAPDFASLQSLDWLQGFAEFSPTRTLKANCLQNLDCGVVAALRVPVARDVGVCRFAHGVVNMPTLTTKYERFDFQNSGGASRQASRFLAGSILAEIAVPANQLVTIRATNLAGETVTEAELSPDPSSRSLTLVVSNSDFDTELANTPEFHRHFTSYYDLTQTTSAPGANDIFIPKRTSMIDGPIGPCDMDLIRFEVGIGGGQGGVNPRECDLVKVPNSGGG